MKTEKRNFNYDTKFLTRMDFIMKKCQSLRFGVIALIMVIGFSMLACGSEDSTDDSNNTDTKQTGSSSVIAYSTDGIKWTKVNDTKLKDPVVKIAYGNGTWLAVTNGLAGTCMAYSTDGVTWNAVSDDLFGDGCFINGITWGNGRFVAVGNSGMIAYSTNCVNWTEVKDTTFGKGDLDYIDSVTWGDDKFIAISAKGTAASVLSNTDNK
jgi:hypothetical protein